jgi:hypothetical protein
VSVLATCGPVTMPRLSRSNTTACSIAGDSALQDSTAIVSTAGSPSTSAYPRLVSSTRWAMPASVSRTLAVLQVAGVPTGHAGSDSQALLSSSLPIRPSTTLAVVGVGWGVGGGFSGLGDSSGLGVIATWSGPPSRSSAE